MANDAIRHVRRDRHGRGIAGPIFQYNSPRYRSRDKKFEDQFALALADLDALGIETNRITFKSELVPRIQDLVISSGTVPLGRIERGNPNIVVLYQQSIELRSANLNMQMQVIKDVLAELIGRLLGRSPTEIDPTYQGPIQSG